MTHFQSKADFTEYQNLHRSHERQNNGFSHQHVKSINSFTRFPKEEIEQSVATRIEKQVAKHPNHLAVKEKDYSLTYNEFNRSANRIAHAILNAQSIREKPIILLFKQGINFLVSVFGVLKTGNFYVPIDPSFPKIRNSYILADSQATLIVTNSENLPIAENLALENCDILNIDSISGDASEDNLELVISPDALAYLIYTSGSTGKPKGVFQNNRNLLHNAMNQINTFHLGKGDRMPLVYSCSVMGAVRGSFSALLSGMSLYPIDVKLEGFDVLRTLITEERITVFHSVATLFRHFVDNITDSDLFPDLRLLILGGEAMNRKDVELYKQHFPQNCLLCTGLGSTEAGTISLFMLDKQTEITSSLVPPGYTVEGVEILLMDGEGKEVEVGSVGEIVVKSKYLALGYWRQPDLTEKLFSRCPENSPERLFQTGDMGRFLPDGCLVHVGRKDFQVKIRGYRVNLSEIELALMDYRFLKETVVVGYEDSRGEMFLVAYLVFRQKPGPTVSELRIFLCQKLPDYMIPSRFVFLDSLPLTANGKVDRLALPTMEAPSIQLEPHFVLPSSPTEEILANIWTDVLGTEQVSIHDNFFELGGHSLLATQVISRCRQAFKVEILLQSLFENPTIATFAQTIAKYQNQNVNLSEYQTISLRKNHDSAPLSYTQEVLWFIDQLEPSSSRYNIKKAFRLNGYLNIEILQQALDAIVAHHEILRTNYLSKDGNPIQVIARQRRSVELQIIDLKHYGQAKQKTQVQKILQQESQRPFNLKSDMLLRSYLLQLTPQEHILLLVVHHISFDGWSMSILWEQLTQLYQAFLEGKANPLEKLPFQYADYAVWQREWLTGEILEKQLKYWQQQLAGANPLLELPTDRPRPPVQSYHGASLSLTLPLSLSDNLKQLCRQEGVTLYMTLLAAFQILLYRYSGQEDIIVGSPIAGRTRADIEGLIGFFSNALVLRTNLSGNPSFQELLRQVRSITLDAYSHQDLPFEKLVEELNPERSMSYTPLFQVMFVLQNTPGQTGQLLGLTGTPVQLQSETSKFDLTLSIKEKEEALVCSWYYKTDLFNAGTIDRMTAHFQTLLEAIIENPQQPIAQLPLLTKAERQQLLVEWNDTRTEYSQKSVNELFEEQVERTPNALALEYAEEKLTYRELNTRANQLAHYLRSLGVGADKFVGISVERSLEMVVGLLGILKAGGAYVPLDPAYPPKRLAYMISDAKISVLLTQNKWKSQLPEHQAQVICLDSDWQKIALYSQENPIGTNIGENLAYVIYTSGSTGKPKGVMISHQALTNFTQSAVTEYQITASDRMLQFASINFDASVEEIYPCLCKGATLVFRTDKMLTQVRTFFQICEDLSLTVLNLSTAYWHELTAEITSRDILSPESLRLVIVGGEKILPDLVKSWQENILKLGNSTRFQLINTYGPTETTVTATLYRVPVSTSFINGEIPIGRPLPHILTYILDQYQQPVPIGVPGELHIGGESLARGYLNLPELTADKFISDPFNKESETLLYKTGDLARYLPDGNIEFIGRVDNQVKIRGFRIELGEIETVLAQHPSIREAVVIVREVTPGDKRLVTYIISQQEQLHSSDLRSFLEERLPNYMVPSGFVFLDTMPLTPNGKVDRDALPTPDTSSFLLETNFVPPRNPTEKVLSTIWADVLGKKQVGIHDNFFELGGHSLLATRVISKLNQAFSVELSLRNIFETPTIADLAIAITQSQFEHTEDEEIAELLTDLEGLSDEEVQQLLAQENENLL